MNPQTKAIIRRKALIIKRSSKILQQLIIPLIIFTITCTILKDEFTETIDPNPEPITFNIPEGKTPMYVLIYDNKTSFIANFQENLDSFIQTRTKQKPIFKHFNTYEEFVSETYLNLSQPSSNDDTFLLFGYGFYYDESPLLLYNGSTISKQPSQSTTALVFISNFWKTITGNTLNINLVELSDPLMAKLMRMLISMIFITQVLEVIQIGTSQAIDDIRSDKRKYMIVAGLKISNYWLGTFIVDYIFSISYSLFTFLIESIFFIDFKQEFSRYLFGIVFDTVSMELFNYCISFLFKTKEVAMAFTTQINALIVYISLVLFVVLDSPTTNLVLSFLPPASYLNLIGSSPSSGMSLSDIWADSNLFYHLLSPFYNAIIYFLLLILIEKIRKIKEARDIGDEYEQYKTQFITRKRDMRRTDDGINYETRMEQADPIDYAVSCKKISRLFISETNQPVFAVNDVSLGVRRGTVFGFLGPNGAGKSTLLKILTKEIPPSHGTVNTSEQISICPQFNEHLSDELTPMEHFYIYAGIAGIFDEEATALINHLVEALFLEEFKDKLFTELNGGSKRKTALIISLLTKASIIFLDEPTSSLDPLSRNAVHNIIRENRDQKTFLLCTQLLDEADSLCSEIAILLNGCLHAYGTPQALEAHFGQQLKFDVLLENTEEETKNRVLEYVHENLAGSEMTSNRGKNLNFVIPSDRIEIEDIFEILTKGYEEKIGIEFFTASSLTLESVFLDLVAEAQENEQGNL